MKSLLSCRDFLLDYVKEKNVILPKNTIMLRFSLTILSFIFSFHSLTQWNQILGLNMSPTENINCVNSFNANLFYGGQNVSLLKSTDQGNTWSTQPILDMAGDSIIFLHEIHDVYFTSPTTAYLVGVSSLTNQYIIYYSANGGLNWSVQFVNESSSFPRNLNAIDFPTTSKGFVAGTNGRIFRTTNGGVNWNIVNSGVSANLRDLHFIDEFTGFATGGSFIIKTINGGSNWSVKQYSGVSFRSIHFPSYNIGYAVGDNKKIYKTINNGSIWTPLSVTNIPGNVDFTSVEFVNDTLGYVTGGNAVYRTTTGGLGNWEKVNLGESMNQVHFDSSTGIGMVGGNSGHLYVTNNADSSFGPIANFSYSPGTNCHDSLITLNNLSDSSLSYQWLLNGNLFSTDYNTSLTINDPAQTDTIGLVVSSGPYIDTFSQTIYIKESLTIPLSIGLSRDTVCRGQTVTVSVFNSAMNMEHKLLNGSYTQIGASKWGGANTITFSTGQIQNSGYYTIRAIRSVSGCGTHYSDSTFYIHVDNPNASALHFFDPDTICRFENSTLYIPNSEENVTFKLMSNSVQIGVSQIGNGNMLGFPTNVINQTTNYQLIGTSDIGCITNYSVKELFVENPEVYFLLSNHNPEINEPVEIINNSINPGGTFLWDFGLNANPSSSSNAADPTDISYPNTGIRNIELIATSFHGCQDTLIKTINVIDEVTAETCDVINYTSSVNNFGAHTIAITRDRENNMYTLYRQANSPIRKVYTEHGDSLNHIYENYVGSNNKYTVITKHSPEGIAMWSTYTVATTGGKLGDIVTDSSGNVYMAYYHDNFSIPLSIYSSDGKKSTVFNPNQELILIKYDKYGQYQWHVTQSELYSVENVSIKIANDQHVFLNGSSRLSKVSPNGTILWTYFNSQQLCDNEPDNNGGVYVAKRIGLQVLHLNENGVKDFETPPVSGNATIGNRFFKMDDDGNFYISSKFRGTFSFAGQQLQDIHTGGASHEDVTLSKMRPNGDQVWIKHFKSPSEIRPFGMDFKDNTLVLACQTNANNVNLMGDTTIQINNGAILLYKCDTVGNNGEFIKFYDATGNGVGDNGKYDNLYLYNNGQSLDMAFHFINDFVAPGGVNINLYPVSNYRNNAIYTADVSCAFQPSSTTEPIAYFYQDVFHICQGDSIQFTDMTSNSPTEWNWYFEGGTANSLTTQHPIVTYLMPGTYSVQLVASNAFGVDTFTSYVTVLAPPNMQITGVTEYCPPALFTSFLMGGSSGYTSHVWSNGTTATNFPMSVVSDTTIYLIGMNAGCVDTAYHSVTAIELPTISYTVPLPDTVCIQNGIFSLPNGIPAGGTYSTSSPYIISGQQFNPSWAAPGSDVPVLYNYTTVEGCVVKDTTLIHVGYCTPTSVFSYSGNYCVGDTLYLTDLSTNSPTSWSWNFGNGAGNSTVQNPFIVLENSGNYVISLTASNNYGVGSNYTDTVIVYDLPTVVLDSFSSTSICRNNDPIALPVGTPLGGTYTDQYNTALTGGFLNPSIGPSGERNIYYTYTNQHGCESVDSISITIIDAPVVVLNPFSSTSICRNNDPIALPVGTPLGGIYTDQNNIVLTDGVLDPSVGPLGERYIYYEYTDGNGCSSADSASILIDDCLSLFGLSNTTSFQIKTLEFGEIYEIIGLEGTESILLYDSNARLLAELEINLNSVIVDLQKYLPGIYFIVFNSNNVLIHNRLIRK